VHHRDAHTLGRRGRPRERRRRCGANRRTDLKLRSPCLGTGGVLRLYRGRGGRALAQLAAGRFARPGAGVDLAHDAEPLLGLGQRRKIAHVQPEAFAAFLETAAHEEIEALQVRELGLSQRHRRGGRAQIEDVRTRGGARRRRLARADGGQFLLWCHNFPDTNP
jgi:hypothetical protein